MFRPGNSDNGRALPLSYTESFRGGIRTCARFSEGTVVFTTGQLVGFSDLVICDLVI